MILHTRVGSHLWVFLKNNFKQVIIIKVAIILTAVKEFSVLLLVVMKCWVMVSLQPFCLAVRCSPGLRRQREQKQTHLKRLLWHQQPCEKADRVSGGSSVCAASAHSTSFTSLILDLFSNKTPLVLVGILGFLFLVLDQISFLFFSNIYLFLSGLCFCIPQPFLMFFIYSVMHFSLPLCCYQLTFSLESASLFVVSFSTHFEFG